jgi:hypothetical protein
MWASAQISLHLSPMLLVLLVPVLVLLVLLVLLLPLGCEEQHVPWQWKRLQ